MRTVFFDIDSQNDFMLPAGALYVPGAERTVPVIGRLNRFAAARAIPVVSSVDAHAENDPEFRVWPPHCIAGTLGQAKPPETLLEKRVVAPVHPVSIDIQGAPQILFEKQTLNLFENRNIGPLLDALGADRYVVYGVVTEYCVRFAALGLLETGKPVILVTDAIQTLCQEDAGRTLQEVAARGGKLATVAEICA